MLPTKILGVKQLSLMNNLALKAWLSFCRIICSQDNATSDFSQDALLRSIKQFTKFDEILLSEKCVFLPYFDKWGVINCPPGEPAAFLRVFDI